jgi:hypothetical protein
VGEGVVAVAKAMRLVSGHTVKRVPSRVSCVGILVVRRMLGTDKGELALGPSLNR